MRPADANEMAESWKLIMKIKHHPVCLVATRQALPTFDRTKYAPATGVAKGATSWPVPLPTASPTCCSWPPAPKSRSASKPTKSSKAEGAKPRVVSMPSWELFDEQDEAYRNSVLPPTTTARVSVEQPPPSAGAATSA